MKYGGIVVEKKEYEIVKKILVKELREGDRIQQTAKDKLLKELKSAKLLHAAAMPTDIVRLNSTVTFVLGDLSEKRFKIVQPEQSNLSESRLSLLSPMGLALFGYSQDDVVEWQFPSGPSTIRIIQVEQDN
jgi:regulator of nucleoside diphosphate kinase